MTSAEMPGAIPDPQTSPDRLSTRYLEQRLLDLGADLAAAKQASAAASDRARTALLVNEDPDAALSEKMQAETRVQELEGAIEELRILLPEVREAEAKAAARTRMIGIHRAYTSLVDQRGKDVERIEAHASGLFEAVAILNRRQGDLNALLIEALVLQERFGTEVPDLPRPMRPAADGRAVAALRRVAEATLADPTTPPARLAGMPYRVGQWSLRKALERISGTPTAGLLEQVGSAHLADQEAWEAKRKAVHDAARDTGDAARRAAVARYDTWLRECLASGPVLKSAVEQQAAEAGLRFAPSQNHAGSSIRESAERLGVVGLVDGPEAAVHWALPDRWDAVRFRLLSDARPFAGSWR